MHNVLIVEDHPMMVQAIKASVHGLAFKTCVYTASSLSELQTDVRVQAVSRFSLIVADLNLPDSDGLSTFYALQTRYPLAEILIFSQIDDFRVEEQLLRAGVTGYVAKTNQPKILIGQINKVLATLHARGSFNAQNESSNVQQDATDPVHAQVARLSSQHFKVLKLVASGQSTTEIAARLEVHEQTVRLHLSEIYRRLAVKNRSQAIARYFYWVNLNAS